MCCREKQLKKCDTFSFMGRGEQLQHQNEFFLQERRQGAGGDERNAFWPSISFGLQFWVCFTWVTQGKTALPQLQCSSKCINAILSKADCSLDFGSKGKSTTAGRTVGSAGTSWGTGVETESSPTFLPTNHQSTDQCV